MCSFVVTKGLQLYRCVVLFADMYYILQSFYFFELSVYLVQVSKSGRTSLPSTSDCKMYKIIYLLVFQPIAHFCNNGKYYILRCFFHVWKNTLHKYKYKKYKDNIHLIWLGNNLGCVCTNTNTNTNTKNDMDNIHLIWLGNNLGCDCTRGDCLGLSQSLHSVMSYIL